MIVHIAKKEILDNLKSSKIMVLFLVPFILINVSVINLYRYHVSDANEYQQFITNHDETIKKYGHPNRTGGSNWNIGRRSLFNLDIFAYSACYFTNLEYSLFNDPINSLYGEIDFIFIVLIIMSLLALCMSYDSISGEKEEYTLKLLSSYDISKTHVILGKWLGGMCSILAPYVLSIVSAFLVIVFFNTIQFTLNNIVSFCTIIFVSCLYLSFFYLVGLIISSSVRKTIVSIVCSLFVWTVFVLIIPNVSPYIASTIVKTIPLAKVNEIQGNIAYKEKDRIFTEKMKNLSRKYNLPQKYNLPADWSLTNEWKKIYETAKTDSTLYNKMRLLQEEEVAIMKEVDKEQRQKFDTYFKDIKNTYRLQRTTTEYLSLLSPYANFLYFASALSGLGQITTQYNLGILKSYDNVFEKYYDEKWKKAREKDPRFAINDYIDYSDRPRVQFSEPPYLYKLNEGLLYLWVLVLFNILAFILALFQFRRYDVR